MTNSPFPNKRSDVDEPAEVAHPQDLVSEWQYARLRLANLKSNPDLRVELILTIVMLGLVFIGPATTWFRRWTLSPSIQAYAILIIPAVLLWTWIARRRLAVPEIDIIRKRIRIERQTRIMPKEIGLREKSVLDVLISDVPIRDMRSRTVLMCALAVDVLAFWVRDPSLTCLGFILTCAGLVLYRHGKFAFRAALFPFLLMFAMIPIPGPLHDAIVDRAQPAILGMAEHMVNNVRIVATVPLEGDPLIITAGVNKYSVYAERTGLCLTESMMVLLCAVFYLSLIRTSNPIPKIAVVLSTGAACFVVMLARLLIICWAAVYDKDIAFLLEVLTRFLLIAADIGLLFLFIRGFKCVKFHRWVSLSRKF